MSNRDETIRARQLVLIDPKKSLKTYGDAEIRGSMVIKRDLIIEGKIIQNGASFNPSPVKLRTSRSETKPREPYHAIITSEPYGINAISVPRATREESVNLSISLTTWNSVWSSGARFRERADFLTNLSKTLSETQYYKEMERIISRNSGTIDPDQVKGEIFYPGGAFEHIWGACYQEMRKSLDRVRAHHQAGEEFYNQGIAGDKLTMCTFLSINSTIVKVKITIVARS